MVAEKNIKNLVDGLLRGNYESYANIRHNVYQSLMELSKRLIGMFNRETMALQHDKCDAICGAAVVVQKLFVQAPEVVDKSLRLIVRHSKRAKSAKPGSPSVRSANYESQ